MLCVDPLKLVSPHKGRGDGKIFVVSLVVYAVQASMYEVTDMEKAVAKVQQVIIEPTIDPAHREWMNAQIADSLARSQSGAATFKPVDQIAEK